MYDDKFIDMKDMFVKSVKDQFTIVDIKVDSPKFSESLPEHFKFGGGINIWTSRVRNIITAIQNSPYNEPFIFSDIDIVFYKPILPTLNELIREKDVLFLRELFDGIHEPQGGNINFGFNIIKPNEKTYKFFCDVLDMVQQTGTWEQKIINNLLYGTNDYDLRWDLLPPTFLSTSVGLNNINKNTLLYHANCAVTKQDKYNLISQVNDIVLQTSSLPVQ